MREYLSTTKGCDNTKSNAFNNCDLTIVRISSKLRLICSAKRKIILIL